MKTIENTATIHHAHNNTHREVDLQSSEDEVQKRMTFGHLLRMTPALERLKKHGCRRN